MESIRMFTEGVMTNFFITFISCLIPLGVGVGMIFLCRINDVTRRIIKGISQVTESISPIVLLIVMFYNAAVAMTRDAGTTLAMIGTFTVCFLGYFPARYRADYSVAKNIVVNAIGLFADILKWSFVVGYIGALDFLRSVVNVMHRSYDYSIVPLALVVSFSILIVLNGVKYLLEEKMR